MAEHRYEIPEGYPPFRTDPNVPKDKLIGIERAPGGLTAKGTQLAERDRSAITEAFDRLESSIDGLGAFICHLTMHLSPVLQPKQEKEEIRREPIPQAAVEARCPSPTTLRIVEFRQQVERIREELEDVVRRLEV